MSNAVLPNEEHDIFIGEQENNNQNTTTIFGQANENVGDIAEMQHAQMANFMILDTNMPDFHKHNHLQNDLLHHICRNGLQ
jgi:tRNA U34 5-methylaminomethyl-2-thiouridine-forming methyltransferase MnmC